MAFLKNNPLFIVDGVRTPVGVPYKGLKNFTAAQMAAVVIQELLRRRKIKKDIVSEVILGNVVSAGTGQNLARQAVFLAGLPLTVPAYMVSNVCGSGLQAMIFAIQSILSRQAEIVIAGGTESATHTPHLISKDEQVDLKNKLPVDSLIYDGLWCVLTGKHMGELCEATIRKNNITRLEQDEFAFASHRKAVAAKAEGKFDSEIVPVNVSPKRIFSDDDHPRKNIKMEALRDLPPAFQKDGTITAGNSSTPCDGAGAVLLASGKTLEKFNLVPKARILNYASIAVDPNDVFSAGIPVIQKCLEGCGLNIGDIDLFEISEAFAAQAILTKNALQIPDVKLNIFGGDIALGHPLGSAGTRVLITLIHALIDQKKKRGVAAVCLGGGGAVAMAVEIVSSSNLAEPEPTRY